MYKAKYFLHDNNLYLFRKHRYLLRILIGFIVPLFMSNLSYAITPNPGATCQGIAGASQGSFTNADYTNLVSAVNTNNYVNIAGNASGSIPLQIKMTTVESSANTVRANFGVITASNLNAINIRRTFPTPSDFTDVTLDFRNSITAQPIYLTNVALSAFDIDYANSNGNTFDDFVQITGVNKSGATIAGTFQSVTGSNIFYSQNRQGLLTRNVNDPNCPAKNLGTQCQGSVQFSQPVSSVKIRYTNTGYLSASTNQEIDFRVDNYCYVPQYVFSGTVFDDNGGITAAQASATNADITTGPYANNSNYFNGIFNPPQEIGMTGSTVKLVNCAAQSTVYATQEVSATGTYQISAPATTINSNLNNICLVEDRSGNDYPVRTNNASKTLSFAASTYSYPNNNFGRVIVKNVALVLTKYQYINNCPATLNYAAISESTSPNTGFSTSNIEDIEPGKCIAYKITATNRANVNIDNFVMADILQKSGVNNAALTSVLANPALDAAEYDSSSPAIGQNGTIKTKPLVLSPRAKRNFYFNTKYGTIANAK